MATLTDRQSEILSWIDAFIREHGWPPTLREIGAHFDIASTNGVSDHLVALVKKRRIVWKRGQPRSIRVLRPT